MKMDQLIIQRLTFIENQIHEINSIQDEAKKWRIIVQHWIRRTFDFDVEKQMDSNDLAFYYEPPSVGSLVAKNIHTVPQLEPLLRKHQLEIADYIKKINSSSNRAQNQVIHSNSIPSRTVSSPAQQQQFQLQKKSNLISQIGKNHSSFIHTDSIPQQQSQQQNRQRTQNYVQNQQVLHKQKQQERELAWLQQISRPVPTGPGPGERNISRKVSSHDISIETAVGPTRSVQLQRLPVTIEKINAPAPISLSMVERDSFGAYNHQSSERRIPAATRNPSRYAGNRNLLSTSAPTSSASNFQELRHELGRPVPGSASQQQNVTSSQKPSVPFAYECQTCGMKFRLKSAAQLHLAKVHSKKQTPPASDVHSGFSCSKCLKVFRESVQLQIHEANCRLPSAMAITSEVADSDNSIPIIMSVAGGGKRYVRKEKSNVQSTPISLSSVSVPSGLSVSIGRTVAESGTRVVLDEITISDDEGDRQQIEDQPNGTVSISSLVPPPLPALLIREPSQLSQLSANETIGEPLEPQPQMQQSRISTVIHNYNPVSSSPASSSPVKNSFILSSKLSSLLTGTGVKVGDKRPMSSPSTSPDKRNRPNQNVCTTTVINQDTTIEQLPDEEVQVVAEGYEYDSPTNSTPPPTHNVISINDEFPHKNKSSTNSESTGDNSEQVENIEEPSSPSIQVDAAIAEENARTNSDEIE